MTKSMYVHIVKITKKIILLLNQIRARKLSIIRLGSKKGKSVQNLIDELKKTQGNGARYILKAGSTPPWLLFQLTARLKKSGTHKDLRRRIALDRSVHFNGKLYDLCAIAVHRGSSITGGHYYAYFKYGDHWFAFNDLKLPKAWYVPEMREVLKSLEKGTVCAYGLMYQRRI